MREQKPVLVDMWATWCKNCLVMDRTTLADPAVTKALDGYVKIKFQAEQPDEQPARPSWNDSRPSVCRRYAILRPRSDLLAPTKRVQRSSTSRYTDVTSRQPIRNMTSYK